MNQPNRTPTDVIGPKRRQRIINDILTRRRWEGTRKDPLLGMIRLRLDRMAPFRENTKQVAWSIRLKSGVEKTGSAWTCGDAVEEMCSALNHLKNDHKNAIQESLFL